MNDDDYVCVCVCVKYDVSLNIEKLSHTQQ